MPRRTRRAVGTLSFNWQYLINELVVRLILSVLIFGVTRMTPFERRVYGQQWYDHYYPYSDHQVFSEKLAAVVLGGCLVFVPVLAFLLLLWFKKMPKNLAIEEAVNFLLGVSMTLLLAGLATELIKNSYGRPRPDFLSRCFGNDKEKWPTIDANMIPDIPICTNNNLTTKQILDGRKSFPSGHTSLSFAVYGFLGLFLYRKLSQIKNSGSLRIVAPCFSVMTAAYIGITRTQDYRHFISDVYAGAILGSVVAYYVWRFYDRIMESTYRRYRELYGLEWDSLKDVFNSSVPAMYTPSENEFLLKNNPNNNPNNNNSTNKSSLEEPASMV